MIAPALVMLGIGFGAAGILAAAAKIFHVDVDPRIGEVEDVLPGANCGGCGYAGCGACAEGMVAGKAPVDACIAGGPSVATAVAGILGGEVGVAEPRAAVHKCTGGDRATRKYHYEGAYDCRAMYELYGGDLDCRLGCLGLATCVKECSFDALEMNDEGFPEVIENRCTGCGGCERVCPTGIIKIKTTSERLMHFNNDQECLAPCKQLCPAQIDIPRYIDLASKGQYVEALEVIKERNPLPSICGRVCPAPCEVGCRRVTLDDEPVHHNYIKRFVADWAMERPTPKPHMLAESGKKVAIVGGGPAGLSAAYYLRRLGHHPTILDAKPELGGMLRYGIPEYRLPKKVLDYEIQEILDLGVDAKTDVAFGKDFTIQSLEDEGYDAILLAMGAWDNSSMRVDGEDLPGVWKGTEFLQKRELGINVDLTGKRVVVVGGGNTAMDAARSSLRMGAASVTLLYRRTRKEMPANAVEIHAAEEEGVQYHFLAAPTKLVAGDDGAVKQIEYLKMELGEPDASGRRSPVPIEGSETLMDVDVVIAAIGQKPLKDWYTPDLEERGLRLTKWNTIEADESTLQSDIPHIFTGGDLFTGPALLIDAVGAGRRAARSIHKFLRGEPLAHQPGTYSKPTRVEESMGVAIKGVTQLPKVAQPELPVEERIKTFDEVDLVVSPELMEQEANRCMRCGTLCYFPDTGRDLHVIGKPLKQKFDDLVQLSPRS